MTHWRFLAGALASIAFATAGAGCGGSGGSGDETDAGGGGAMTFVAFAKDFSGYHGWQSYDVTGDAELAGIHDGSTVTEYINHLPPSGRSEFPLGTIIVKEATGGTIPHELFAMVKQGPGFNDALPGWFWFELENKDNGKDEVSIVWEGVGPPDGETYGGDPNAGGCNSCHLECGNDGVCAKPLNLANF
jgi:hypothetical protein